MSATLFDPQPGRDYTPEGAIDGTIPTHGHTGDGCVFCATRTGAQAKAAATQAVTRDLEWWSRCSTWLDNLTTGHRFTADDLVRVHGKPEGSANQIGAFLRVKSMADVITPVDVVNAGRAQSHARLLRVWAVA